MTITNPENAHTYETRYFGTKGRYPVLELPERDWPKCKKIYKKISKKDIRSY